MTLSIGQKVKRRDGKIVEICSIYENRFDADGYLYERNGLALASSDIDIIDFNPSEWSEPVKNEQDCTTLTRREQFAMAAMTGLLANPTEINTIKNSAEAAVAYADALIAALDDEKP